MESKEPWVVMFYNPYFVKNKSIVDKYEKLFKSTNGLVKVGAINIKNNEIVKTNYGIKT
jgi:thioredoxin-like negative regulator of GroEL